LSSFCLEAKKAIDIDSNSANVRTWLGPALNFAGKQEEAIVSLKKAILFNPITQGWYLHDLAVAFSNLGRYDEAIAYCEKTVERHPLGMLSYIDLASSYSLAGREEGARAEAVEVFRINPEFSLYRRAKTIPQKKTTKSVPWTNGPKLRGSDQDLFL
jgi:tetratricopeptide (TPR) repeat protein